MRPMPCGRVAAGGRRPRPLRPGRLGSSLLLAALTLLAGMSPASAAICPVESRPAATLLLPYFEVNLDDPNGLTTLFSVNDASAAAVLTHVVIWSDLAVPVLTFSVYLTGYDVQTINLRDILLYGNLPQTASVGQDPNDTISPKGLYSQDIDFASCRGQLPLPPLPHLYLTHVQNALTGKASPLLGNLCAGRVMGDNIARGYVTIDTVNTCTLSYPGEDGYFAGAGGAGAVTDQNVLWGVWYIVNAAQGYAQGGDMVAIQADGTNPATSTTGSYTFYGAYDGWTAVDHRQPLATTFAAPYATGGGFSAGTDLLVWRDPKVRQEPFACPATSMIQPVWYPLTQEAIVIFDEQETGEQFPVCPFAGSPQPSAAPLQCPPSLLSFGGFGAATQRITVGDAGLPVPFDFGWLFLDLNRSNVATGGNNPPADPRAAQAWVIATQSSHAHFAVALEAYRLDSACSANHSLPHQ